MAVSADSKLIATGSCDQTVKLWDLVSGACIHTLLGNEGSVVCVDFSSYSKLLACAHYEGAIIVWGLRHDEPPNRLFNLRANFGGLHQLRFSPDSKKIASAYHSGVVVVWSAESGAKLWQRACGDGVVWCVAWSPDGKYVSSGGRDNCVTLLDARTGTRMTPVPWRSDVATQVTFGTKLELLACGGL